MSKLSDTKVKAAKPKKKAYTLSDGLGLTLKVNTNGTKLWYFRFYWYGEQQLLSLGRYPEISLLDARKLREQAREYTAKGIDPRLDLVPKKKAQKQALAINTPIFKEYTDHWKAFKIEKLYRGREQSQTKRQSTLVQINRYLKKDLIPGLGDMRLDEIKPNHILRVLRKIEERNATSIAEKCRCWLTELFSLAVAEGYLEMNPATEMKAAARAKPPVRHNPFLIIDELPQFLQTLNNYRGDYQTKLGIKLLLLTGVRPGELRYSHPSFFNLEKELWLIPPTHVKQLQRAAVMDKRMPHYTIPLPKQAIAILKELETVRYPNQHYLLGHRDRLDLPISENTLNGALRRMGYAGLLTSHGIRGTISTALNEKGYNKDWVEAQLSHSDKDNIRATYNHAKYVDSRRQMMQDWADLLDQLEQNHNLIQQPCKTH